MTVTITSRTLATLAALPILVAGCGNLRSQGPSPSQVTITALTAAGGTSGTPTGFSGFLLSDVMNHKANTVFDDVGRVAMTLHLKDPGAPGVTEAPSALNEVTFTRYHVTYRRSDGRNTEGIDVPYAFDSAVTFTVGTQGGSGIFEIVRHAAKFEAPLKALTDSSMVITTIAEVTFYGKDQAGNNVAVIGSIQINFGDFPDA